MRMRDHASAFQALLGLSLWASPGLPQEPPGRAPGHSIHGEAFDEGPRQEAQLLGGMGKVHFPVTTSPPEAQCFFDQGVAQLHTFYYFEAERSFRQVGFLDPKCAMAYWGMAMANVHNGKRARAFLEKARGLAERATDRERKYIEALSAYHREGRSDGERRADLVKGLEAVALAYPDDIEARAFLAWTIISHGWAGERISSRVAVDTLTAEVLRRAPLHPGAHHYRIHLWDDTDPAQALDSARAYARAAPGIAHAWHMPGHIYNGLSRFEEAAYQQEAAARLDHVHMLKHGVLPFQIHNYAHNQHYLIANLSHLGRVRDAIAWSRNLIETPRDPEKNEKGNPGSAQRIGRFSLMRIYVRYERWDDLLLDPRLDWSDVREEKAWQSYSRGLAYLEKSDRAKADQEASALDVLDAEATRTKSAEADLIETMRLELRGRQAVRDGKLLEGFEMLERGARLQVERFRGDLARYPRPFREALGFAHLEARNWGLAEANFREVLSHRKNTLVSLVGLVEACYREGKLEEAGEAYRLLVAALQEADQDLPYLKRLEPVVSSLAGSLAQSGSGTDGSPPDPAEKPRVELEALGTMLWRPSPAPHFTLEDSGGKEVRLEDFRGKNVLLVLSLGSGCPHCLEQLLKLGKDKDAWEALETRVLVVSDESPEKNRELLAGPNGPHLPSLFLSDSQRRVAKLYRSHDTFEDLPLHGLVLIDRLGNICWSRIGSQPFLNVDFLKSELERINGLQASQRSF